MSYQEERLQEIADAIREVKGTTEKIPATNFASEIAGLSVVKPSGIITIKENGSHNVANYEWAEVSVEADLNERVIIGKWVNANGLNYVFQTNGVFYIHEPTFSGTYTIDGFNINATSDVFGETETILYVYDDKTDTIVQPDTNEVLTRVQETANLITKEVTENGTYTASDDGADGYSEFVVNVASSNENTSIVVTIPEGLQTSTTIYAFQLSDNKILLSGNVADCGLWLYTISTGDSIKVYSDYGWRYFQQLNNGNVLINGNGAGILLYSITDNSVTQIHSTGSAWDTFAILSNGDCLFIGQTSSSLGVWLYSITDNSVTHVYTKGYWKNLHALPNGDCFITSNNNSYKGILLYSATDKSVTNIYTDGYNWRFFKTVADGDCLITNYSSTYQGVLLYSATDKTITQIYAAGYQWQFFQELTNGDLLIGGSSSSSSNLGGILLYSATDKTITNIYSSYKYEIFQMLPNGDCLIGTTLSTAGLKLYSAADKTITHLQSQGAWQYCQILSNGDCLWSNGSNIGLFSLTDKTFTILYTYAGSWNKFEQLSGDKYLISHSLNTTKYVKLLYDNDTKTIYPYYYIL